MEINQITEHIIGAAIRVHRALGPGLLESSYQACLEYELTASGLGVEREYALPLTYRGVTLDCGYRIDLLVEHQVVVEIKSVAQLEPVHTAQILTYLKLSGAQVGLLINFNVKLLTQGLTRVVRGFPESPQRAPRALR